MAFSDKNLFSEPFSNEPFEGEVQKEDLNDTCENEPIKGRAWEEVEHKEIEMINGIETYLGKTSQQLSKKTIEIMKEWKDN
jgi:hypothetical protein